MLKEFGLLRNSAQWEQHFTVGSKWSYISIYLISCPNWVKFGIRAVHIMLYNILKFRENRRRQDCAFASGANQLTLTSAPQTAWHCYRTHPAFCPTGTRVLTAEKWPGTMLITRLHLDSFRMSGGIPLLPLCAFMSWTGMRNIYVLLNGVHDVVQSVSAGKRCVVRNEVAWDPRWQSIIWLWTVSTWSPCVTSCNTTDCRWPSAW